MSDNYFSAISSSDYYNKIFSSLKDEIKHGISLYRGFMQNRLNNAVQYFSPNMKNALYEIIFLLHFNHPNFERLYLSTNKSQNSKRPSGTPVPHDLYLKGVSPVGVLGFNLMPQFFFDEMRSHINKEFRFDISQIPAPKNCPIVSISSLGSIGTIAHKLEKSDLDLQIQYSLNPLQLDHKKCSDGYFQQVLNRVEEWYSNIQGKKDAFKKRALSNVLPNLYKLKNSNLNLSNTSMFLSLTYELGRLCEIYEERILYSNSYEKMKALQLRIDKIAQYIQLKYPEEEVHFFAYSIENYRQGIHGSTLVSKESSGTAYEKILTYETLMPGIYYNGVMPSHFLFGENINNNLGLYKSLMSCIKFRLLDRFFLTNFNIQASKIVDTGNTPFLSQNYLDEHRGAVYWEAFKGSSGNLSKSFLNLLRLENLYHAESDNRTIIQLIKKPDIYGKFLSEIKAKADKENLQDPYGMNYDEQNPFSLAEIYRIELQNSVLLYDPWWWRYKMLKIFYQHTINLDYQVRQDISLMIDVCFALHVGLEDIFSSEHSQLNDLESLRIRVLNDYFENCFPALTNKRKFIEQVFKGELSTVNFFEDRIKKYFKDAINRILNKKTMAEISAKVEEKKIWLQYYEQNFEPKKNQVPRNILSNIHKLRGRLQISFDDSLWHFKTIPFLFKGDRRFNPVNQIQGRSEKISLYVDKDFVKGLLYCIVNNFYGVNEKQVIKTSSSLIEFTHNSFTGNNSQDIKFAKITSDLIEMMAVQISNSFPSLEVDYRQAILSDFKVTDILFLFNILIFGRVHVLYRDLLDNYYVLIFDHPEINAKAYSYSGKLQDFIEESQIIKTVSNCLKKFKLMDSSPDILKNITSYWINPLSVEPEINKREEHLNKLEVDFASKFHHNVVKNISNPVK